MRLRRIVLCVTIFASLLLSAFLVGAQCLSITVNTRAHTKTQLSLANLAGVSRLDAMLQTGQTQARMLTQTEDPVRLLQTIGLPAVIQHAPLWMAQSEDMRVALLDAQGFIVYANDAHLIGQLTALDEKSLANVQKGQAVVTPRQDELWPNAAHSMAVLHPVQVDGDYWGCVMVSIDMTAFEKIVQETGTTLGGTVVLFDATGRVVASHGDAPYTTLLDLITRSNFRSQMRQSTPFDFHLGGTRLLSTYTRLQKADWNVLCTVTTQQRAATFYGYLLPLAVVALFALALALALNAVLRRNYTVPMRQLHQSIVAIEAGDYSRNVPHLGKMEMGEVGRAFNDMLACIRRDHAELAIKEARHRIVNEQTNSIIFEYNIETSTVQCSPNGRMLASYPACMEFFPDVLIETGCVSATEGKRLDSIFCAMKRGRHQADMELQLRTYNETLCWFHLQLSSIVEPASLKPLRIVGKLTDIDEAKREAQHLAYQAQRDALTGLYNKETTHSCIVQRLASRSDSCISALFVADIDCFKRVNDGYGHQKGDEILAQVARALQKCMRPDDIVGRMGGDEFMLLMSNVDSVAEVEHVAHALVQEVRTIVLDAQKGETMSLSIGIALCPQDGIIYQQLYAHADNAAYAAKRGGKNSYAFYRAEE